MEVVGDPSLWGKTFTIVNVANAGRRPITVTNIGAFRLHPADPFVVGTTRPPTPHELKEGNLMTAMIEQKYLESADIEHWKCGTLRAEHIGCISLPGTNAGPPG